MYLYNCKHSFMQPHEKFVSSRGTMESRTRIFVINTARDTFWALAKAEKERDSAKKAGASRRVDELA